ncbi:hypothetical protein Scep_019202 [Stephania cephalantha]|uniref:Uncharacterized protein n=1 Tax=Stephania cephalantha TaxID=152367 RepID=A0AAP0NLX7_9MAGN
MIDPSTQGGAECSQRLVEDVPASDERLLAADGGGLLAADDEGCLRRTAAAEAEACLRYTQRAR